MSIAIASATVDAVYPVVLVDAVYHDGLVLPVYLYFLASASLVLSD